MKIYSGPKFQKNSGGIGKEKRLTLLTLNLWCSLVILEALITIISIKRIEHKLPQHRLYYYLLQIPGSSPLTSLFGPSTIRKENRNTLTTLVHLVYL